MKKLFYLYYSAFNIMLLLKALFPKNEKLYMMFLIDLIIVVGVINEMIKKPTKKVIIGNTVVAIVIAIFFAINIENLNHVYYPSLIGTISIIAIITYKTYKVVNERENKRI